MVDNKPCLILTVGDNSSVENKLTNIREKMTTNCNKKLKEAILLAKERINKKYRFL